MKIIVTHILVVVMVLLFPVILNAHPGRTASDGCHYCRTNCDRWGEVWDERHCHNYPAPKYVEPVYIPKPQIQPVVPHRVSQDVLGAESVNL